MSASAITEAYERFIESEERRASSGPRPYVYASSWSACTRHIALDLINPPGAKSEFGTDTLANFRRGKDRARDIKADMTRVGRECTPAFDVVGAEERFELRDKKGRVVIVGKVDFRLKFDGERGSRPVETKSFHPNLTQGIKRFDDLFQNRWTRKGAHQLLSYLLATDEPVGYMLLDRPGIPKILEVNLYDHLDKAEDFLRRSEIAMAAREEFVRLEQINTPEARLAAENGVMPAYIDDPGECRVCPYFGSACNPPLSYGGADIITEEEILAKIERHEALDEPRSEYAALHGELADYLKPRVSKAHKGKNKKQIIAGKYLLEAGWSKNTTTELPETETVMTITDAGTIRLGKVPFKARFQKSDDAGKFGFSITKVSE